MVKTSNKDHLVLLDFLLQQVNETYQACLHDRKKIHDIEWGEDDKPSVLGEVEVLADFIVGHVTKIIKCKKNMSENDRAEIIRDLETRSVFGSNPIAEWIVHRATEYPSYYAYLQSIECLRVATIAELE